MPLDLNNFEIVPPKAVAASKILSDAHLKMGSPADPFSKQGEQMMRFIIAAWEDLYPKQVVSWTETRKEYKDAEMSTSEQVHKQTGRSLASIPTPIYRMMRKVFPNYRMDSREDFLKLVKKYEMFQMANKV